MYKERFIFIFALFQFLGQNLSSKSGDNLSSEPVTICDTVHERKRGRKQRWKMKNPPRLQDLYARELVRQWDSSIIQEVELNCFGSTTREGRFYILHLNRQTVITMWTRTSLTPGLHLTNKRTSQFLSDMEAQIPTPPLFVCSTSENCIQGAQNSVGFESIFRQALSCPKSDKNLIFPLSYNITPESNITITNSTCQYLRNCIENGMMNMHTDARG